MGDRSIPWDGLLRRWHPTRVVVGGFLLVIAAGALLLHLPAAEPAGVDVSLWDTLLTATSAGTVTGLTVIDTATGWTTFGQVVILVLAQIGGFELMAVSSMVAVPWPARSTCATADGGAGRPGGPDPGGEPSASATA